MENHGATYPGPPSGYQAIRNASWPPRDIAAALKDRPGIPVTVRIDFERDGVQLVEGLARRWWQQHVCVECEDRRLQVRYVWVNASDVTRRVDTSTTTVPESPKTGHHQDP